MKYLFLSLLFPIFCISQVDTTMVKIIEQKIDTVETSSYNDYENDYSIEKPDWLKVDSDLTSNMYGGVMPKVNGIENAIMITAFKKNRFENFKDFQRIYITGNTFGKPTLYSDQYTWYGRNERDFKKVKHGVSSRVFYIFKKHIYHNQFVLLETSSAYLFVHFCSTPETYDDNIKKFNEFLKGLKVK